MTIPFKLFSYECTECDQEINPGEYAVASIVGSIEDDGGFYAGDVEGWYDVRHTRCPDRKEY